ncbi:MAG: hypothetical protein COU29_00650 [Candidatus Magasanikbacteria bacterium CG10_big_fil_rev_8_21_14_0_10_36_32]|uniref:Uncharacterized protein n=1 Tax=Candidatus Magasanikbacteria bacterium CG10_big_fil_rev_8_21_14_0_10_36_32 TaxID=1974646 RepID=A0A2M6W7I5_9BACT|nr:MAG: hypothetical protein COU29_00650 [Candidatus Magasanikbacteria bacterium CG10_big_fil_rev_8_21_14_0_10_36_32]
MKKGMFFVLFVFAILSVSACGSAQFQNVADDNPITDQTCTVIVDRTQSLDEMIQAGRYSFVSDYFTAENFPVEQPQVEVEVTLHVITMNRVVTTNAILAEIDKRGLRPATLSELLAFGVKYPSAQRHFSVVAFGSIWSISGFRVVTFLSGDDDIRALNMDYFGGDWDEATRFLAVVK